MPLNTKIRFDQLPGRNFGNTISEDRANNMADAFELIKIGGLKHGKAAEALGRSRSVVTRQWIWAEELAKQFYLEREAGTLTDERRQAVYSAWREVIRTQDVQVHPDRAASVIASTTASTPETTEEGSACADGEPEGSHGTEESFSFLEGEQAREWFTALRTGSPLLVACDAAMIEREQPIEWIEQAKLGSEEHIRFVKMSRAASARAYVKLGKLVVSGRASKVQHDYLVGSFSLFDNESKSTVANDELSTLVGAALVGMREAAEARRQEVSEAEAGVVTPLASA